MQRYGLIGEKLNHSWSKIIHEQLAPYTYDLIPLTQEEFTSFMEKKNFTALNVTIPYKEAVIPYLDEIEDTALEMKAVNTIVNRNGKLYGYNTDYLGFLYTLDQNQIHVEGKKCIVLGNGGASKAILAALKQRNAGSIVIVNRSIKGNAISYEDCYQYHTDASIIINTTPAGMYPLYLDQCPIDLAKFSQCEAVVDIVYNPLKTKLLQQAEDLMIPAVNGLEMLVAQAKYAIEHFLDTSLNDSCIEEITKQLTKEMSITE